MGGEPQAHSLLGLAAVLFFILGCFIGAAVIVALRQDRLTLNVGVRAVFLSGLAMLSAFALVILMGGGGLEFAFLSGLIASVGAAVLTHRLSESHEA